MPCNPSLYQWSIYLLYLLCLRTRQEFNQSTLFSSHCKNSHNQFYLTSVSLIILSQVHTFRKMLRGHTSCPASFYVFYPTTLIFVCGPSHFGPNKLELFSLFATSTFFSTKSPTLEFLCEISLVLSPLTNCFIHLLYLFIIVRVIWSGEVSSDLQLVPHCFQLFPLDLHTIPRDYRVWYSEPTDYIFSYEFASISFNDICDGFYFCSLSEVIYYHDYKFPIWFSSGNGSMKSILHFAKR